MLVRHFLWISIDFLYSGDCVCQTCRLTTVWSGIRTVGDALRTIDILQLGVMVMPGERGHVLSRPIWQLHQCKLRFFLRVGQQSLVDHNLATRHAEGVCLAVLYKIELPTEVFDLCRQSIADKIVLYCRCQTLSHAFHHGSVGGVG